ncbi:MAG: S9 family peptidase [Deltaproteobacteria bacterium]|nr:S9 family peptidase [Deltaproteobacteria bacterium]
MLFTTTFVAFADTEPEDPHLWLEEVQGEEALDWVRKRNEKSIESISKDKEFTELQQKLLNIYNSKDRIPYVGKYGTHYYNFWRDADHQRGIWRRTTMENYRSENPKWETVLDLDSLAEKEDENWVWHGANCLPPEEVICMIALSRGGADADVKREFNTKTKSFVKEGFSLPEAKSRISWLSEDELLVGTDFGPDSLTNSGYPRISKIWKRGTPLSDAQLLMEISKEDMSVSAYHSHLPGYERTLVYQTITFYTNRIFLKTPKGLVALEKQDSAMLRLWKNHVLLELREDWTVNDQTYKAGSLLTAPLKPWLKGTKKITVLFEPSDTTSLLTFTTTKDNVIISTLDNVQSKVVVATPSWRKWKQEPLQGIPQFGQVRISAIDSAKNNEYWLTVRDYITPDSLYVGTVGKNPEKIKSLPAFFDSTNLNVSQHFATSQDGTKVPYFQVSHKDTPLDGSNTTLLYGYGGFEISLLPSYSPSVGIAWLEKGGVYVVANIRGGGEYGPRWHQAALKEKRHKAYEDFAAVGQDLVQRKVTSTTKIGIQGGSNGGLLMGNMYTTYPDHWGAIVCQVPLLDMKRYTKLLAGASWAGEYGDPEDPKQWSFLKKYSPYHNIDVDKNYPPMLITTSTRDDRVHPGHARKMSAALEAANKNIWYFENIEGGHGGSANNEQASFMRALAYTFLWQKLTRPNDTTPPVEEPSDPNSE